MESLYFEDLTIGLEFVTGPSAPITQGMLERYFELTNDRFNIHRDPSFARRFGLPDIMAPGNLVVAIATGLVYAHGHFADSLLVQAQKAVSFLRPVLLGERIHVAERVIGLHDRPQKPYGRVVLERTVFNSSDQPIIVIEQDYRVLKRDAPLPTVTAAPAVATRPS